MLVCTTLLNTPLIAGLSSERMIAASTEWANSMILFRVDLLMAAVLPLLKGDKYWA